MTAQTRTRMIQGLVIGLLGSGLIVALFSLRWLLPYYGEQLSADLTAAHESRSSGQLAEQSAAEEPDQVNPTGQLDPLVPTATVIGQPLGQAISERSTREAEQVSGTGGPERTLDGSWRSLSLAGDAAVVRVPGTWPVEYRPGGLIRVGEGTTAVDILETQSDRQSLEQAVLDLAQADQARMYVGFSKGVRAQGPQTTVVGFEQDANRLLFSVQKPSLVVLEAFEAIVQSVAWL